jgi:serine/threonine protein kinase/tetratricopeptide (TPR) repeat protein
MGEVYEAEDLVLKSRLALKTIRPEISEKPHVVERFKREILLARRVTHPNICRIHDLGFHRIALGSASPDSPPELMFLTMELLSGESLNDRLNRVQLIREREALPILEQIAAGLDAAHGAGVIHRDLKSGNVMILPPARADGPERVVITDFGLAHLTIPGDTLSTLSELGAAVGTPAYMSPEQLQGKKLGPGADIYALGVIAYEMVSGSLPFEGDTPVALAVARLTGEPLPPLRRRPDLDPRWNVSILKCLERLPEDRFLTAAEFVKALRSDALRSDALRSDALRSDDSPTATFVSGFSIRAILPRLDWRWGAGVLVLAAAVIAGWLASRSTPARSPSAPVPSARRAVTARRSVAMIELTNTSGRADLQWLNTAILELLGSELGAGDQLRIIPGQEVVRATRDIGMSGSALSAEGRSRLRKILGADLLVAGSYGTVGADASPLIRVDLRVEDSVSGRTLASSSASGTAQQLSDVVSRAGKALRQSLGLPPLSPSQDLEVGAAIPSNPEAARLYAEGISRLRSFDAKGAADVLARSVQIDPKNALARVTLATAWSSLGYETHAREEAGQASALAENLSSAQRSLIEGRSAKISQDWDKAITAYSSLFRAHPDAVDYGVELAEAQTYGGKAKEALVTVEELRRLPAPLSEDLRIDLANARAFQELGDFKKQQAFASHAVQKGRAAGLRLVVARARLLESTALLSLGDSKAAAAAIEESRSLYEAAGDRKNVARVLEQMVGSIYAGDLEGGRRLLDRAFTIYRDLGDRSGMARVRSNIGLLLVNQGRIAEAQRSFDESLAIFRQIGAKYEAAAALNQMGVLLLNRGDLPAAQKRYQEALTLFGDLGEKSGTATTLSNIAEILAIRGRFDEARKMNEEALADSREIGDKAGAAYDLYLLGELLAARGELFAAREKYQEALSIQNSLGDAVGAADTRVSLARLSLAEGKAEDAEEAARQSEEILRDQGAVDRAILAQTVVVGSLLNLGRSTEAKAIADQTRATAGKSDDRRVRLAWSTVDALVRASSGKPEDVASALQTLKGVTSEAAKNGFLAHAFEARLAAGEIDLASGKATGGFKVEAVAKEAREAGFGFIARRAESAMAGRQRG